MAHAAELPGHVDRADATAVEDTRDPVRGRRLFPRELLDPRRTDHRHVELRLSLPPPPERLDLTGEPLDLDGDYRRLSRCRLNRRALQRHAHAATLSSPSMATDERRRMDRLRARATSLDTQPGLLTFARRLRQRLPGDERFGDSLSTAGVTPVQVIARGVSAMQPERDSVVKELGLTGLQLWQSLSEATGRGRGERELALLFTDLVGFSSWALDAGDAVALELLRAVGDALEIAVLDHGGRIVKRLGDGVMATFVTAQSAVEAALDAQDALGSIEVAGYRPRMRAGIHWGRPRKLGSDYLGVDVNVAARVADCAKAEQVVVSDSVLERIDAERLRIARPKRLKAKGAPRELRTVVISRA
jgi:adenylate cyclase